MDNKKETPCSHCEGKGHIKESEFKIQEPHPDTEQKMRECELCYSVDGSFSKTAQRLHEMYGMHRKDNITWQPTKGHSDWDTHVEMKELGIISTLK